MQLLFNKIYLKLDHLFKGERDRIVISPRLMSTVINSTFRPASNGIVMISPKHQAATYSDLISDAFGGDEDAFIRYLIAIPATERLTIYCSVDAYVEISTKFWKTVYPRLSPDEYYRLVNFTVSPLYESLATHKLREIELQEYQAYELRSDIGQVFEDEDVIKTRWAAATPYKISRQQRESMLRGLGVEYQLPTVLVNPSWRHAEAAKKRIIRMIQKEAIADFVFETKYRLLDNLDSIHVIDPTVEYDSLITDLDDFVKMHPRFQFLVDDKFTPDAVDYILATYDLDELEAIRTAVMVHDLYAVNSCGVPLRTNLTFDEVIEMERTLQYGRIIGNVGEFREKVNPYIIDYVLSRFLDGDTNALQPYILR